MATQASEYIYHFSSRVRNNTNTAGVYQSSTRVRNNTNSYSPLEAVSTVYHESLRQKSFTVFAVFTWSTKLFYIKLFKMALFKYGFNI